MKTTITVDHADPSALAAWLRAAAFWVEANAVAVAGLGAKPVALVNSAKTQGELREARS